MQLTKKDKERQTDNKYDASLQYKTITILSYKTTTFKVKLKQVKDVLKQKQQFGFYKHF